MKKVYIVLLVIFGVIILVGVPILYVIISWEKTADNNQNANSPVDVNDDCWKAGFVTEGNGQEVECCAGLVKKVAIPYSSSEGVCKEELSDPGMIVCVDCGNGICEQNEQCVCPVDCS